MSALALPHGIHTDLEQALDDALRETIVRSGCTYSDAHSALWHTLSDKMVSKARAHNDAGMLGRQLPNETWCMVWQELPLSDRFRVTHVCRSWRTIAQRCPRVWCYIDLWLSHAQNCPCPRCLRPEAKLHLTPRTTVKLVHMAVARSQRLPLCVQLNDGGLECVLAAWPGNLNPAAGLGQFLAPQAGRIVALHADLWAGWVLPHFVSGIGPLPVLQVLSSTSNNLNALGAPMVPPQASLPHLRDLSLTGGWAAWPGPTIYLSTVERLRLSFAWCNPMRALIDVCPKLSLLHVDLPRTFLADETGDMDSVRQCLSRIPHVRVSNLTGPVEMKANLVFNHQPRATFECEYSEEPSYLGTSIFSDIDAPYSFSCMTNEITITMQAAADDKRRILTFPYSRCPEIPAVWYSLRTSTLRSLAVPCSLWTLFADPFPMVMPCLEEITVVHPSRGRRLRFTYEPGDDLEDEMPEARFPALRLFTVRGPTEGLAMYRSSWNHFLRSVGAQRPSVRCELVRFTIVDDPPERPQCRGNQESDGASLDGASTSSGSEDDDDDEDDDDASSDSSGQESDSYGSEEFESDGDDSSGDSQEDASLSGEESDADTYADTRDQYFIDGEYWENAISDKQGLLNILAFSAAQWKRSG